MRVRASCTQMTAKEDAGRHARDLAQPCTDLMLGGSRVAVVFARLNTLVLAFIVGCRTRRVLPAGFLDDADVPTRLTQTR